VLPHIIMPKTDVWRSFRGHPIPKERWQHNYSKRRPIIPWSKFDCSSLAYTTEHAGAGQGGVAYYKAEEGALPYYVIGFESSNEHTFKIGTLSMTQRMSEALVASGRSDLIVLPTRRNSTATLSRGGAAAAAAAASAGGSGGSNSEAPASTTKQVDWAKLTDDQMDRLCAGDRTNLAVTAWIENEDTMADVTRFSDDWCINAPRKFALARYRELTGKTLESCVSPFLMRQIEKETDPDARRQALEEMYNGIVTPELLKYENGRPVQMLELTNRENKVTQRGVRLRVKVNFQSMPPSGCAFTPYASELNNDKWNPVTSIFMLKEDGTLESRGASALRAGNPVVKMYVTDGGITKAQGSLSHSLVAVWIIVKQRAGAEELGCEGLTLDGIEVRQDLSSVTNGAAWEGEEGAGGAAGTGGHEEGGEEVDEEDDYRASSRPGKRAAGGAAESSAHHRARGNGESASAAAAAAEPASAPAPAAKGEFDEAAF